MLPLSRVTSRLFGDSLVSTPFCVYGGVAAVDEASRQLLIARACDLAQTLDVDVMELRHRQPVRADWPRKQLYATFRKPIAADAEANLLSIPRKQRAEARRGIKNGLQWAVDPDSRRAYDIYAESVRNLGTPVFARDHFRLLDELFGDAVQSSVVEQNGRPQSAVVSFRFRDEILPYYGGALAGARPLGAYAFLYYQVMAHAGEAGARWFDFGRSKRGTGSYDFKRFFGFEPQPLHYEQYLVNSRAIPEVNPLNPKYRLFIAAWKRLPLAVANRIGPLLAGSLG
ncbi:putative FemAB-like protein, PEP-CTERM system-associated [Magnetofaba australis IT-1]|uniref:Putative FemAB-like protein, PEP-CTERM system-associated n=1 Tax=Magnetofaba australis IT-1 TaxID=1434232 RepID=A0A1Y2K7Z2_9PROT|nr:putative FemAB-like protein, PEP-CTERM system-associated [Magnetofaba australis IT-1]